MTFHVLIHNSVDLWRNQHQSIVFCIACTMSS